MVSTSQNVAKELSALGNPEKAVFLAGFFKTGKGQYAEGDVLIGVTVPEQRKIAKKFRDIPLDQVSFLLTNKIHEFRLTALFILVLQYQKGDADTKKKIFDFYLKHRRYVNNWDLVDSSAPHIVGDFLLDKDRSILYDYARGKSLWDRRIAVVATQRFIREGQFEDTLKISEILLKDSHDLIHKAAGWMLREVGDRDRAALESFLKKHCRAMPRTMLRYAIEHFEPEERKKYLER
ncbi:DNA alkylation repair protein [Patescibacteria group bacterium]|nr:DNA alkylation repair protein [Patescibacteria group bacterium]MBU1702867.1 DNA alkylation repair protein [Patescibacteria group bacterium]MBU1954013.1 DNA alkylation repair protein [Patescibacteria group bacterium]